MDQKGRRHVTLHFLFWIPTSTGETGILSSLSLYLVFKNTIWFVIDKFVRMRLPYQQDFHHFTKITFYFAMC